MEPNAPSRKRRQGGSQASRPPVRITRDKKAPPESPKQAHVGTIRSAKDSAEVTRVSKRVEVAERSSLDDDPNTRHFTVANVGRNGTLYLKPSRMGQAHFAHALATPPGTSDGPKDDTSSDWPLRRSSSVSGTYTPRRPPPRATAINQTVSVPPLSIANVPPRRRTRSHSFSTVDDAVRSPTFDSNDFQILLNGKDASQRPKSSIDLTEGVLNLRIPHYRLGTPRFSDRGTAYLHNSAYTSITDDLRSSVFSRGEWDKLFPTPKGGGHGSAYFARQSSGSPYLHPSQALVPSRTPPTPSSTNPDTINPTLYDKVEANINDPTLVKYSLTTGRIIAATPARLISQITSPFFLDYELLADFFLTFRNFLSSRDLMEHLLARIKWALSNDSDAGRIVRVRTFVAIRHWILNYFADDFLIDLPFRQRFCNLVNDLAHTLRQRPDQGGTDMNVVRELKKCWRRTCAMFWPAPDALDTSPEAEILPGQSQDTPAYGESTTSLPLSVRRHASSHMDFRRSSQIQLPVEPWKAAEDGILQALGPDTGMQRLRTASIPASPMSEQSLTVLSCSVPFLRHLKPSKDNSSAPHPVRLQKNAPNEKSAKSAYSHKRSGSFTDALRDERPPLPSHQPNSIDIQTLPSIAMTGGLVRGLLLQPSPSKVDILIPLSPDLANPTVEPRPLDSVSAHERHQNASMKKVMGDVRRAISRKGGQRSPSSSNRSTNSSDSRGSGQIGQHGRRDQISAWQQLKGPPRVDKLGEKIEGSYREAFESGPPSRQLTGAHNDRLIPDLNRLDSHVTTGSRSIVIVDATRAPELPPFNGALPSVSSWASNMAPPALFRNAGEAFEDMDMDEHRPASGSPTAVASDTQQSPPEVPFHDLLSLPQSWKQDQFNLDSPTDSAQARKSSNVHPTALVHHQLRKRPGGDLKAADHVHDLERAPRPYTGDSYSTFSQAITSGEPSRDLSGTHFSGQFSGLQLRDQYAKERQRNSVALLNTHSSQPNMRPSFAKEVSHLAHVNENQNGGGIEDALAKLEGKTSSLTASDSTAAEPNTIPQISKSSKAPPTGSMQAVKGVRILKPDSQLSIEAPPWSPQTDRQGASIYRLSGSDEEPDPSVAAALSEQRSTASPHSTKVSRLRPRQLASPILAKRSGAFPNNTERKKSDTGLDRSGNREEPKSATPKGSFLLDDNESLSDISTEIADQSGDEGLDVTSFFFDDTVDDDAVNGVLFRPPPTPPSTEGPTANHSPERSPALSPTIAVLQRPLKEASSAPKLLSAKPPNAVHQLRPGELRRVQTAPTVQKTAHLPFVLAFDSDVIAEQMTIIEKDALDEVDWKDLISLRWQQAPCHCRNWVDFLKTESNGIDIVVARFNLVVKWVVSECLLTEASGERAKCITKYIHIANNCHRLRNYASLYQITLALLSSDISRLRHTWSLVPPTEKQMLLRLEKLCQPIRNFHHLRTEMEAVSAEEGCIPFIGLYTHDLMFNAQKQALIDPAPPGKEKLINFERYQTAANIVKGLLRLIESSSKYIFRPHPEVLSRCLWLAALEDAELTARSKTLEP